MSREIYSLRMRSSQGEKHISGAERLVDVSQLEEASLAMVRRALNHPRGMAENISLTLQPLERQRVREENLLKPSTFKVADWHRGRQCASGLLESLGLSASLVQEAISLLAAGPSPSGGVMRGAMLIDAESGQRLETDSSRGVRVSRMDVDPAALPALERLLNEFSSDNSRVIEAWVLASKVALYPQIIAELCWSDDPDYLTGYVASAQNGYQRITRLKEAGSENGGRIFFVRPAADLNLLIDQLQYEPVLFAAPSVECA